MPAVFSQSPILDIKETGKTLGLRLQALHEQLLETVPELDRIACAPSTTPATTC